VSDKDAPGFEADIKRMFRESDREAMMSAFDLWSFDDVKGNAAPILAAVRAGSMPCDVRWPDEKVNLLQRWVDSGTPR